MSLHSKNMRIHLACMPKSGSTYLSRIIASLPGMRGARLVPGYGQREQELDEERILDMNKKLRMLRYLWKNNALKDQNRPLGWIAQHHTRYSAVTHEFHEKYKVRPLILTRNIFDVVPSLFDHLKNGDERLSMACIPEKFQSMTENDKYEFIAVMIIPWYINFFVSWQSCPNARWITYEEINKDPVGAVVQLFQEWGIDWGERDVTDAVSRASEGQTRKNKGIIGRGEMLSEQNKKTILQYAKFYPDVDFSLIGISDNEVVSTSSGNLTAG